MVTHIATQETFMHGAMVVHSECILCGRKSNIHVGWVAEYCPKCGGYSNPFDMDRSDLLRQRLRHCGIKRKDFAALLGVSPKTVSGYSWGNPSRKAMVLSKKLYRKVKS